MTIFVDFTKNQKLLRKVQQAPIYQQNFSAAPLPHQLHLLRNPYKKLILVRCRSGKYIIKGHRHCFIGLSVDKKDTTAYIVDSHIKRVHFARLQQAPR